MQLISVSTHAEGETLGDALVGDELGNELRKVFGEALG